MNTPKFTTYHGALKASASPHRARSFRLVGTTARYGASRFDHSLLAFEGGGIRKVDPGNFLFRNSAFEVAPFGEPSEIERLYGRWAVADGRRVRAFESGALFCSLLYALRRLKVLEISQLQPIPVSFTRQLGIGPHGVLILQDMLDFEGERPPCLDS